MRRVTGRQRRWLLWVAAILTLPMIVWAVLWTARGWLPQGDQGLIALKTHDVFSAHPPVQGMPSTSWMTVPDSHAHHLGPIEFYLLAVPYAVTGWHPVGLLVGCVLLAASCVATAVWHAHEVGGRRGVAMVVVAVVGAQVVLGGVLVLPWNPFPPILALVALAVLGWRLLVGHVPALPWFVAMGSLVAQANLALLPMIMPLVLVVAGVGILRWHRSRGTVWPLPGWRPAGRAPAWWRRPGILAVLAGVLMWLPALIELWTISPNNVAQLWALGTGVLDPVIVIAVILGVAAAGWASVRLARQPAPSHRSAVRWVSILLAAGMVAALGAGGSERRIYLVMGVGGIFFAVAAWCDAWLVLRIRRPMTVATVVVGVLGLALLTAPDGPVSLTPWNRLETHEVDVSRHAVNAAMARLHGAGIDGGPVIVRVDPGVDGSYLAAAAAELRARGYQPYYDTWWPLAQDDDFRRIANAPAGAAQLVFTTTGPTVGREGR